MPETEERGQSGGGTQVGGTALLDAAHPAGASGERCHRIHPRYLFPTGMKITAYNKHRRLLLPQRLSVLNQKTLSG